MHLTLKILQKGHQYNQNTSVDVRHQL